MEATYNIQGKEYIAMDLLITSKNRNAIKCASDKFDILDKEIKQVQMGGWFKKAFIVISIYVPLDEHKDFIKCINSNLDDSKPKSNNKTIEDKSLAVLILIVIVSMIGAFYAFSKIMPEKPSRWMRIKTWWKNKFSKKQEPTPEPATMDIETKSKGLFSNGTE